MKGMSKVTKAWMITGANSGSGKTTITIALLRALKNKGYDIQPFKCGPDYIDPMFHKIATARPSYSLDGWMLTEEKVKSIFFTQMQGRELGIVEGVMGYYDGLGLELDQGSSYQIARCLEIPALLVVDGSKSSTSVAAVVKGFLAMAEPSYIKGVIVNKVSGEKHYQLVKGAIEKYTDISCYGYMPYLKDFSFESRHLGLVPTDEIPEIESQIDYLAQRLSETVEIDRLVSEGVVGAAPVYLEEVKQKFHKRVAIAKDAAFNFYYASNLDLLAEMGVELVAFSPLKDKALPEDIQGLYLGGGYPEVYAQVLANNHALKEDIKNKIEAGLPTYAECGGLMYLTESITDKAGNAYEMVGVLPAQSSMTTRLQHFGYVDVQVGDQWQIKGHEFHYSKTEPKAAIDMIYKVMKKREGALVDEWMCGYRKYNLLGTYVHLNFENNRAFLEALLSRL